MHFGSGLLFSSSVDLEDVTKLRHVSQVPFILIKTTSLSDVFSVRLGFGNVLSVTQYFYYFVRVRVDL